MSLKVEWEPPEPDGLRIQCEVLAAKLGYRMARRGRHWSIVPIVGVPASGHVASNDEVGSDMTLEEVATRLANPWPQLVRS